METHHYWEENGHNVKYDNYNSNDGFGRPGEAVHYAPLSEDEAEYPQGAYLKKGKVSRQDPMSHRIIEKRRRDRMNNCLADLSRLIPPEYLKKGRGRVEKTEIIEMAIRHIKFLQDRVNEFVKLSSEEEKNAAESQAPEPFRVGYQEAVGEAVRFLVEVQGFSPADSLCVQMAAHLQRHCEIVTKANDSGPREKVRSHIGGSSSETASSSSSSHGYMMKGVIQRAEPPPFSEPYEPERPAEMYMECDRVPVHLMPVELPVDEPLPLDRHKRDLRKVRKPDHDDYLHSYKFKNSIERRFSRSQDSEAAENSSRVLRAFTKRRRANKPVSASTSASTSGSTEDARDTSPQDTSSESPHHHQYEKPVATGQQLVPVFALNAIGKYYVPLCVERACLSRGGAWEGPGAAPLHPITIHVNFTPCGACVKREPDWRPG